MNKQQNRGFTLVELIVVITILAILGTIAILALSGYSKNARDSARIADIGNMKKSLEFWVLQSGTYPEPSNGTGVTFSGSYILWNQGTFGDTVFNTVGKLEKKPVDPLYDAEYTYSITNSKKEYELGAVLEGVIAYEKIDIKIIPQTYAANESKQAYVSGNYNGILTAINATPTYILAIPSIILSDLTNKNINGSSPYSLVYHKQSNLPASYKGKNLTMTNSELDFTPQVIWTGTGIELLNNQTQFETLVTNLQNVYSSGTLFANLPEYKTITSEVGLTSTVLGSVKTIIETNMKQKLDNVVTTVTQNDSCSTSLPGCNGTSCTLTFNPTSSNQSWVKDANSCGYVCNNGYIGNDCSEAVICNYGENIVNNACSDPYWGNVTLMMDMEGVNGSTSFSDKKGHTFTSAGGSISNTKSKFGSGSLSNNGSSFIYSTASNDWNFEIGDFTIDFWVNFSNVSTSWNTYSPSNQYIMDIGANGTVLAWNVPGGWNASHYGTAILTSPPYTPSENSWYFISFVRSGNTVKLFIDGVLQATNNSYSGNFGGISQLNIGDYGGGSSYGLNGYLDELRITKGVARYTSNFTPPTRAFPEE